MTVNYIGIAPAGTEATNDLGVRTYTRVFKLETTSKSDSEYDVGSHASLPRIGSVHPSDSSAWCRRLQVQRVAGWKQWTVTANYSSAFELAENPIFEPAQIEWDSENFEEVAVYDNAGDAILNSAGDPYENVMRERTRRVVTVRKNVASVPTWIITAEDAVNSSAFVLDGVTVPTGMAKLGAPRLSAWMNRNGTVYREMAMQIILNKDGWNLQPLEAGFRYRNGDGDLVRAVSDDGTDVTSPVCLNADGELIPDPTPSTVVFGDWDVYPAFDFNTLPLT